MAKVDGQQQRDHRSRLKRMPYIGMVNMQWRQGKAATQLREVLITESHGRDKEQRRFQPEAMMLFGMKDAGF